MNYYNENDPNAAAWLRELISEGVISKGHVDERSIVDVTPPDLTGYKQCHFFAGIGGWSAALRLAGWPDDKPVVTASCPCQPFSQTGKGLGIDDPRHLWPAFYRIVRQSLFPEMFGEQVASTDGLEWLDGVFADLEVSGYSCAASDLCAAGVGAPHPRQRLYWAAYANGRKSSYRELQRGREHGQQPQDGGLGGMAHPNESRAQRKNPTQPAGFGTDDGVSRQDCADCRLEHPAGERRVEWRTESGEWSPCSGRSENVGLVDPYIQGSQGLRIEGNRGSKWTPWSAGVGLLGSDGKMRRVEPGIFPLAHGVSDRVALIRGAGNAICPDLAAEFIQACEEAYSDTLT